MRFYLQFILVGTLAIFFMPMGAEAQCSGASQFPSATVAVATDGTVTSITTCNYADEYSATSGYIAGETYEWTSSNSTDFLTLSTDAAGSNVLAFGVTPLTYTSAGESPLYLHVHADAACTDDGSVCRAVTAQLLLAAPSNDLCAGAIMASAGSIGGTTTAATSTDYPGVCGTTNASNAPGVWYTYLSSGPEEWTVDICGAAHDGQLSVWTGACGALTCVDGEDDDFGTCGGNDPSVTVINAETAAAPVLYHIYVYGWDTGTGPFTLTIVSAPLPVELISFEGAAMEAGNKLTWTTASEYNTEYHAVERSIDGQQSWTTIGMVDAKGSVDGVANYEFMDDRPLAKAYYRLVSVDFDRAESTSEVVQLERKSTGFTIANTFPNPTKGNVTVQYHSEDNLDVMVNLMDITGKTLKQYNRQAENGVNNLSIDMAELSAGTYFINLSNGIVTLNERVVKH